MYIPAGIIILILIFLIPELLDLLLIIAGLALIGAVIVAIGGTVLGFILNYGIVKVVAVIAVVGTFVYVFTTDLKSPPT